LETILTDIRNKESELQKIQKSVLEQQKKTEDLFNEYQNTLTSEIVNLN
jgi:predicted  nucleic acid-binding Zn-ribbon protein